MQSSSKCCIQMMWMYHYLPQIHSQCAFNITPSNLETESQEGTNDNPHNNTGIHFYSKHKYRDTFGDAHIQYHDFDNDDAFVYKDKYTALLQQELQNPYWCLYNPITT